jgi:hypothetical protein
MHRPHYLIDRLEEILDRSSQSSIAQKRKTPDQLLIRVRDPGLLQFGESPGVLRRKAAFGLRSTCTPRAYAAD